MVKLDEIDRKILKILQEDCRITIKELSIRFSLSSTPIFNRIKRMEKSGIIDRYVAILNPDKVGKKFSSFCHVSLKDHSKSLVQKFVETVNELNEVMECHYVTGNADFILKVITHDIESYNQFIIDKLFRIENISKVESLISMAVSKKTHVIDLDQD
ncbi:MAG: Lrp/AsnC family transcriptional regulator [Bacteroidia bacterium]|nr:Lrp/AsnC family transcriptional regulator [Bacteroidia bacterium]